LIDSNRAIHPPARGHLWASSFRRKQMLIGLTWPLTMIALSGCDTRAQRLEAIAEVERACGLPHDSLYRNAADAKAVTNRSSQIPGGGPPAARARNLIYLGSYRRDDVLRKMDCVRSYISKRGYTFNLHAHTFSPE